MTPFVRLEGLRREFGSNVAVESLTFDVRPGELVGIVGPDGAGKTTTLRMLAGVLRPSGGDAWIGGVSVRDDPEAVKPKLAYMPQRFGLYEDLTVAENLRFYADLYRVPRAERASRLDRLYRFSRLDEFEHRLAGALSGGMKQKLSLSCALVHHPELLLLDEPTFGVDPISRRDLWLILHEMVAEGVTVIASTSYMDEAERFDQVALLDEGRLLALDPPQTLQDQWPGILVSVRTPDLRDARDRLRATAGVEGAVIFGDRIHVAVQDRAVWDSVRTSLTERDVAVLDEEIVAPSLEDVFLSLVDDEE